MSQGDPEAREKHVNQHEQEKGDGKRTVEEEEMLPSVHLKGEQDSSRWARVGRASPSQVM